VIVIATNWTYPWAFGTPLFRNSYNGDRKTFKVMTAS